MTWNQQSGHEQKLQKKALFDKKTFKQEAAWTMVMVMLTVMVFPGTGFAESENTEQKTTYLYNHEGNRVMKKLPDGTRFFYPFPDYEVEKRPDGTIITRTSIRDPSGTILEIIEQMETKEGKKETKVINAHTDHLGSSSIMTEGLSWDGTKTDKTGQILEQLDYDPYGTIRVQNQTSPFDIPQKFTGQRLDPETNLYYYGARYYDPGIGRFISPDPVARAVQNLNLLFEPQRLNTYSYALNNPVRYIDPDGKFAIPVILTPGYSSDPKTQTTTAWGNAYSVEQWKAIQNCSNCTETEKVAFTLVGSMAGAIETLLPKGVAGVVRTVMEIIKGNTEKNSNTKNGDNNFSNNIPAIQRNQLPPHAQETLQYLEKNGFKNSKQGYSGGRVFKNDDGYLPKGNYKEWDVTPSAQGRNAERFVTDDKGNAYWTNTHYGQNSGTPFYKVKVK